MATRLLTRSKTLTLTLNRTVLGNSSQSLRPLHSLTAPRDLGSYQPSDSRSPSSTFVPKPDIAAGSLSPAVSSIIGSKKEATKVVVEPMKDVTCFSPLEAISIRPRSNVLGNESLKIKRTELSQNITFALIPALLLISKSSITTSLLVLSVYWQIYGFFKEIFLDYVHQEVSRKWVLIHLKILLLILIKETFLDFGLV